MRFSDGSYFYRFWWCGATELWFIYLIQPVVAVSHPKGQQYRHEENASSQLRPRVKGKIPLHRQEIEGGRYGRRAVTVRSSGHNSVKNLRGVRVPRYSWLVQLQGP